MGKPYRWHGNPWHQPRRTSFRAFRPVTPGIMKYGRKYQPLMMGPEREFGPSNVRGGRYYSVFAKHAKSGSRIRTVGSFKMGRSPGNPFAVKQQMLSDHRKYLITRGAGLALGGAVLAGGAYALHSHNLKRRPKPIAHHAPNKNRRVRRGAHGRFAGSY